MFYCAIYVKRRKRRDENQMFIFLIADRQMRLIVVAQAFRDDDWMATPRRTQHFTFQVKT